MKILFAMRTTVYVRNFESTLRLLARRGHRVHVAALRHHLLDPSDLSGRLAKDHPEITHSEPPRGPIDKWAALSEELRRGVDYLRYLGPEYHDAPKLVHRAERYAPAFVRSAMAPPVARSAIGIGTMQRALRAIERALPLDPAVVDYVRSHHPDLVVVTPLVEPGSPQAQYLRAARSLGIRTALCVYSWDNLTNKGLIQDPLDLVTVWNDAMRREAIELHGVPPDRIVVTGAQPYDQWFEWKPRPREEFCRRVGLASDRPYLLYLCSSKFIAPQEASFVRRWIADIRSASATLAETGVLVRPHPQYTGPWHAGVPQGDAVSVWPPAGANPVDVETRSDFYDSIFHSAAVVGVNTSAQIESAIVGRAVHTILAPEFQDTQDGTLHFRHLRTVNGGLLHVAENLEDHVRQLEDAVRRGGADDGRCRRFVEGFVRPHGLEAPATPRLVEAIERIGAMRPPAPEPLPWYGRIVRSRLEPFAEVCRREAELEREKDLEPRGGRTQAKRKASVAPRPVAEPEIRPEHRPERRNLAERRRADERRAARAWATYTELRPRMVLMKSAAGVTTTMPELQPLWDATPEMLMRLRHFGACVGGSRPSDYVDVSEEGKRQFRAQLRKLRDDAGDDLLVPEPRRFGCFGFARDGNVHTADTLRYFEVLSALRLAMALPSSASVRTRTVVWEIGGGWGGLAYQFKTLFPQVTYVLSAHPDQLLLSATYLSVLFPRAVIRFYGECSDKELWRNLKKVDFVFVPDTVVGSIGLQSLDLVIDLMALEPMARPAAEDHVRSAFNLGAPFFYSALPALSSGASSNLRALLARYYWLHEIPISQAPKRDAFVPWPRPTDAKIAARTHVVGWKRIAL